MLRLEPFEDRDFDTLAAWNEGEGQAFVTQWAGPSLAWPLTADALRTAFAGYNTPGGLLMYRIVDDEMIGTVQLLRVDQSAKTAVVGRFLIGNPADRGRGRGLEALKLLSDLAFKDLGLNQLSLNVYDFNTGAIACYEKAGFRIVSENPAAAQVDGQTWKSYRMVLDRPPGEEDL